MLSFRPALFKQCLGKGRFAGKNTTEMLYRVIRQRGDNSVVPFGFNQKLFAGIIRSCLRTSRGITICPLFEVITMGIVVSSGLLYGMIKYFFSAKFKTSYTMVFCKSNNEE